MSVIVLDTRVFQAVENKLQRFGSGNYIDQDHNCDLARRVFNLHGYSCNNIHSIEALHEVIHKWVAQAFHYNRMAGRSKALLNFDEMMEKYDPKGEAKKISIVQCYKFIQCILYNSDIDSYMSREFYETHYEEEHGAWINVGTALCHFLAGHIVAHSGDYEAAKWSSL